MRTVFFPGSFNPFTKGHADIVDRMTTLCDKVVIGVGINSLKAESDGNIQKNVEKIKEIYSGTEYAGKVEVISYTGLTMEKAREIGAQCVVRGVRSAVDFDYEYTLAAANRKAFGIETILLPADPSLSYVSSSLVRDLQKYGSEHLASEFLP